MGGPATAFGPNNPGTTDPKILVIGLNRCGTHSLHKLFLGSNIPSLHWKRHDDNRNLARAMVNNMALGLPPLAGFDGVRAFSDLNFLGGQIVIEGARFFRELHAAYPDAYFILNTRPVDDWITSRLAHSKGDFARTMAKIGGMSLDEVVAHWRALFLRHDAEVTAYFGDNPSFLRFDITRDDPQSIADLLAPDFTADPSLWGQHGLGHGPDVAARVLAGEA